MKTNINWKANELHWKYKTKTNRLSFIYHQLFGTLLIFFFYSININAQKVTKVFEQEIEVNTGSTIIAQSPRVMNVEGHGNVHIDNTADAVTIAGKGNQVGFRMEKDFNIKTWEKNVVKQRVEITVEMENPAETELFFSSLKNPVEEIPGNKIRADGNLNLNKVLLKNGFFSDNKFWIILDNEMKFQIKAFEMKASLSIPKTSNLTITSEYNRLNIGDLDGDLNLKLYFSEVNIGSVKNLKANLNNCFNVNFNKIENASINAINSYINIKEIRNLNIGDKSSVSDAAVAYNDILLNATLYDFPLSMNASGLPRNMNSMMSTYNVDKAENIIITETANDKFYLGEVNKLQSGHSNFSNYSIKKLNKSIFLSAKSGDVKLDEIAIGFNQIDINNEISTVILNIHDDADYQLNIFQNRFSEYTLPPTLKQSGAETNWERSYLRGSKDKAGEINIRCDRCKISIYD